MKKWNFLVSKTLEHHFDNIMHVEFLDGGMQGESSNIALEVENLEAIGSN